MTESTPDQILARAQVPAANGRPVRKDEIELHDRGLYIESWLPERRSRRKPLLLSRLRLPRLLDALLGLRRIRGFVCRFLGDAGQLLARLALLLTRGLQPLADVSQLLGARHHGLLIVRDLVTRCRKLLLCLLHLPLNLGQLLGLGLELLDNLRLLLALSLQLFLTRD